MTEPYDSSAKTLFPLFRPLGRRSSYSFPAILYSLTFDTGRLSSLNSVLRLTLHVSQALRKASATYRRRQQSLVWPGCLAFKQLRPNPPDTLKKFRRTMRTLLAICIILSRLPSKCAATAKIAFSERSARQQSDLITIFGAKIKFCAMRANELLKVQANTFHRFVQHCLSAIVISKIQAHGKA